MTYLLDTNVVSELRKRAPDPRVLAWYERAAPSEIFLSVITLGEIRLGIGRLRGKDPHQAHHLEQWLQGLHARYADHLIGIDARAAEEWGRMCAPDPIPVLDGLLAASAIVRGWILVTRNTADVARTGVQLLNPFEPARSQQP
jgi:predicted nucleic acid-binding protein